MTLRNDNSFAVKDIDISCAFSRPDGSHLTDRTRTSSAAIADMVGLFDRRPIAVVRSEVVA